MSKRPHKFEDEVFVSGSLARLVDILLVWLVKDMQSTDIRMLGFILRQPEGTSCQLPRC